MMQLNEARQEGELILNKISLLIERGELAGSIRRRKPIVKDIDIVIEVLPKNIGKFKNILLEIGGFKLNGVKAMRLITNAGVQIDIYLANKENYETLFLIRTGSAKHNVKVCSKAKDLNLKLTSNGLIDNRDGSVIATSEKDIFKALRMDYIEPEDRD